MMQPAVNRNLVNWYLNQVTGLCEYIKAASVLNLAIERTYFELYNRDDQKDNFKLNLEALGKMAETDVKNVAASELVDINSISINEDLTGIHRVINYIENVKNPYCYLDHGMVVKISFSGKKKLEDCIRTAMLF